ncbi:efflux RND transporter periplasmic adaptor subunit [Marinoscillum furvescens]|uniref:Membrane fusion protein (Multidrug efflux system) n=1 Tax=Marinoscillum furvescens DSM 4134 TaxID=1122208 RepID=A0A3D9L253_MARFU|nr:efflux RND transporter periplasmic adaptor subunit [Marinoscillum furvescens]RED97992.1 membrane fusion protein (multidrug efflux system) [Marinoscillum furvescens DSM 4134]
MNKTGKKILYTLIAVVVVGIIIYPKLPKNDNESPTNQSTPKSKLTVDAVQVTKEQLDHQVKITGTLVPDESVILSAEVSGKIESIYFTEGQKVKKGDLLLKLNDQEVRAQLEKLRYSLKLNEDMERRQQALLKKEAISQEEYETSLTTLNTSRSEIKVLEAQLAKHHIYAPFNGHVGLRDVSSGTYLTPGTRVAELYKTDPIKIDFSVPSKYISLVNIGDKISFTVDAYDEPFKGEIYAIEPQIDMETRSIRVRAKAPNGGGKLYPGQFARIELTLETIENALMIPTQAVIPELNGKKIFIYKNGKVESRSVKTGIRRNDNIQVTDGLKSGETVITTGILQIQPGAEVNVNLK